MGYESLAEFSINQLLYISLSIHKCMPKNIQDYIGNKVTFLKWEDIMIYYLLTSLNFSSGFLSGITITNLEN